MKGNDRAKTQWFLLYILKSWSEITDRQKLWELRSLYLTENIWKTYIYIYIYTNIHTADEDVNMTAILALINITWAVVKIRPEKKKLQACTVHLTLCKRCVENSLDGAWRDVSLWRLKRFVAFFKFLPTKINLKKKTNKLYKFRIRQYPSVFLTCKWSHSL